jgi:excisionase family DNA binding protein
MATLAVADTRPPGWLSAHRRQALAEEGSRVNELLDYEDAAALLRCSPRLVRKLAETRRIDTVKVGALVRIERAAVERYIEANRRPANDAA